MKNTVDTDKLTNPTVKAAIEALRIENRGLDLTGSFHSEQWGDFRTYFRLHLSPSGRIKRLDIGQAG
jgi:hypothetical protein